MPTALLRIRLGASALLGASLTSGLSPLVRHASVTPLFVTGGWIPIISPQLVYAVLLSIIASLLQALSAWGLYAHLKDRQAERPVLLSLLCSSVGGWCVIPIVGVLALGLPMTAAQASSIALNGIDVAAGTMGIPFLLFAGFGDTAASVGALFLSVALGRQLQYPRWALRLYAVSVPLAAFTPTVSLTIEVCALLFFLLAASTLLIAIWRETIPMQNRASLYETS